MNAGTSTNCKWLDDRTCKYTFESDTPYQNRFIKIQNYFYKKQIDISYQYTIDLHICTSYMFISAVIILCPGKP